MTPIESALLLGLTRLKHGSPGWRKLYAQYRRTPHWKAMRDKRLRFAPYCAMCAKKATQVHHRVYSFFQENINNDLRSVCARCHRNHHRK